MLRLLPALLLAVITAAPARADVAPPKGSRKVRVINYVHGIKAFPKHGFLLVSTRGNEAGRILPVTEDGELDIPHESWRLPFSYTFLVACTESQLAEFARFVLRRPDYEEDRKELADASPAELAGWMMAGESQACDEYDKSCLRSLYAFLHDRTLPRAGKFHYERYVRRRSNVAHIEEHHTVVGVRKYLSLEKRTRKVRERKRKRKRKTSDAATTQVSPALAGSLSVVALALLVLFARRRPNP